MNNIAVFEDNVGLRLVQLTVQLREKKTFLHLQTFFKILLWGSTMEQRIV
jgi:hypothetical protein